MQAKSNINRFKILSAISIVFWPVPSIIMLNSASPVSFYVILNFYFFNFSISDFNSLISFFNILI